VKKLSDEIGGRVKAGGNGSGRSSSGPVRRIDAAAREALAEFLDLASTISGTLVEGLENIIREGWEDQLDEGRARSLIARLIDTLRAGAAQRRDQGLVKALEGRTEDIVEKIMSTRKRTVRSPQAQVEPVLPTPTFHGRSVPMVKTWVNLRDLSLWAGNERLEIHLEHLRQTLGREPNADEILQVMQSVILLPGVNAAYKGDEFDIKGLARSIAVNGVRRPPILDVDGARLLDGNRRVAACYHLLRSNEFTSAQKQAVEKLHVWQLTEHASDADREAVIVSLNFESDHKLDWPDYVRARKVFHDFERAVMLEGPPGMEREKELKRELARKYAIEIEKVDRYIRMVTWAKQFEEHLVNVRGLNQAEVQHSSNYYFQYFDELSKGKGAGGVGYTLTRDDDFRGLVFDLLFQGKFKNWALIRNLKYLDETVQQGLEQAEAEPNLETAKRKVQQVLEGAAYRNTVEKKIHVVPNEKIEAFVRFIRKMPLESFHNGQISSDNLKSLVETLEWVQGRMQTKPTKSATNRSGGSRRAKAGKAK
jgi:hypothetical protein